MSRSSEPVPSIKNSVTNKKISALESSLQLGLNYCKELMKQFEDLSIECEENKKLYNSQIEKCKSTLCSSSVNLKKDIESKNNIIQSVITTLTKLCETKNFNILNDVFLILCGEVPVSIPKLEPAIVKDVCKIKKEHGTPKKEFLSPKKEPCTPNKAVFTPIPDLSVKEESLSEIEGTPTGRTSPILKMRNAANSPESRNKKKCPQNWPTPENKSVKLTFPSPTTTKSKPGSNVRLRQKRLDLIIKPKPNQFIDLTSSPELMSMNRNSQNVQPLIKKESTDNDDTILPSPTSGPNNFSSLCKATSLISPIKCKRAPLCLKSKSEVKNSNIENTPIKENTTNINNQTEDSINLLKPSRFMDALNEHTPIKITPIDDDETHCEIPSSLSILEHVNVMEKEQDNNNPKNISPSKVPLGENKNLTNLPDATDSSMSLLRPIKVSPTEDKIKRQLSCKRPPAPVEPLYKEQLPRTKIEKRKLPGWSCDECKNFFDELYQHDPDMLAKKMDECSKHRGRNNPARPKTPEGFWNPRWSVPNDTEEFNKRNNVS